MKLKISAIVALALASSASIGAAEKLTTNTVEVYSATPLPSIGLPLNRIPANIQIAKPKDVNNQPGVSIADYMNNNMQGITVADMTGSPFQPEINFRGYSASPLLGNAQGLSTYIDGVRVNEPFGDVTLWDKIPNFAIGGMQLVPGSNPIYGLNTLGGSIAIQTKSGREARGVGLEFEAGSWGRQRSLAEYGGVSKDGSVDYFVGFQHLKEDGWRKFSPTTLNQAFAKVGWQSESSKLNLSYIATDNRLIGNGFVPENLLSGGRDQIHTRPDLTNNYYHHLALNGDHWVNKDTMISGNAYYRKSNRHTLNGDNWESDSYGTNYPETGLVASEGYIGSVLNKTKTNQDTFGGSLQASFNQDLFAKKNLFVVGANYEQTKLKFSQRERVNISNLADAGGVSLTTTGDETDPNTASAFAALNSSLVSTNVFDDTRAPIMAGNGLQPEAQTVGLTGKQHYYGLFATNTLSLNDKWHLNTGARYNYSKVDNLDTFNAPGAINSLTAQDKYIRLNPTVGLTFVPREDLTLYTSYSESSRAPTSIELGCSNPEAPCRLPAQMADDPPLKQVVAKTYEFGGRGDLTSNVRWNAAVYTAMNHDDIQFVASPVSGMSGLGYFSNIGRTKRNGLDLGLSGNIDKFKWNTSYSYIDATYDNALELVSNSNSEDGDFGATTSRSITVNKGSSLPAIPKHQLKLRGQYQVTQDFSVGANLVAYSSQYVWGNENNAHRTNASDACEANGGNGRPGDVACGKGKLDAYAVVNLDAQYNIGKGWKGFAKATNIFDHEYDVSGRLLETLWNSSGQFTGDNKQLGLIPGAPRAAWVGFRYEFGGAPEAK
jgi:outer membrane receptor protein involved in Fe transport